MVFATIRIISALFLEGDLCSGFARRKDDGQRRVQEDIDAQERTF